MGEPVVSIILPSLRPSQLTQCLGSIERYTRGVGYEVVVVSPFDIESHPNVAHVKEDSPEGIYKAVALGYERARGEYIIHMPDDTRATPLWAANMIAFMRPHDNGIFEGNFRHFDARGERPEPGYYGKLFAPFLCIRRDKVDRIGGLMDCCYSSFFGDPDLSLRIWYHGGRVETCPNAWIYHADCDDQVHKSSDSSYFLRDREVFIKRWHHIYARPGDSKDFYASHPIDNQNLSPDLPPEECAKLYVSIKRRDWKTVKKAIMSSDGDVCIYPEGFPILYDYVMGMMKSARTSNRKTLYSVLRWLREKGYSPPPSDASLEENLPMRQGAWNTIKDVAGELSVTIGKELRKFAAILKGKN